MRHPRLGEIEKPLQKCGLPFIRNRSIRRQSVGGNRDRFHFGSHFPDRFFDARMERVGQISRRHFLISLEIFERMPQQTVTQAEDELAIGGVF